MVDKTKEWREFAGILKNPDELIPWLDKEAQTYPTIYEPRLKLADKFFSDHDSPIDIAIILYGGVYRAHILAHHIEGNDLIFYRPKTSHSSEINAAFREGDIHPDRTLLIFDIDLMLGKAMEETSDYFEKLLGYDRSSMYGFLYLGYCWRDVGNPKLMQIDDLLR